MGFLPEQLLIAYKFSGRGRPHEHLPTECGNGPNLVTATVTSKVRCWCHAQWTVSHSTAPLIILQFLSLEEVM